MQEIEGSRKPHSRTGFTFDLLGKVNAVALISEWVQIVTIYLILLSYFNTKYRFFIEIRSSACILQIIKKTQTMS